MLNKCAYLAPFLEDIDIPRELLLEDDINILYTKFDVLRDQFKTTHRHLEIARKKDKDPTTFKENLEGLEVEKNHLHAKIKKIKENSQYVDQQSVFLDVIQLLQDQTAQELILITQSQDQDKGLDLSVNQGKLISRLHHIQELANCNYISLLLQKMGQVCSLLRYSKDKLPKELELKRFHLQALQHVLFSSNDVDSQFFNIQGKLVLVNDETRALKRMRYNMHDLNGNELQHQQMQIATIVANKICATFDRLACLSKRHDMLIVDLQHKLHSIEEVKGSVRRGEDLKQYVEALRGKSATYKALKKELDDMAAENAALQRTQHLLEQQLAASPGHGHGRSPSSAAAAGCFSSDDASLITHSDSERLDSTTAKLHQVIPRTRRMLAQPQQDPDEQLKLPDPACDGHGQDSLQSRKVWQQISELDLKLQEHRAKAGPLAKQLKEARATLPDLEAHHAEREGQFAKMSLVYQRKVAILESCVNASRQDIEVDEKQLHESTLRVEQLQAVLDQLTSETDSAVSEELQTGIQLQEDLLGALHQKQQRLKETEHANTAQMTMMKDLLTFLAAKLSLYSSEMKPPIYSTNSALENVRQLILLDETTQSVLVAK